MNGGGGGAGAVTRTRGLEFLFAFHPKENSFFVVVHLISNLF